MLFFAFLIGAAHVFTFASFVRFLARGADVIPSKDRGLVKFVWFVDYLSSLGWGVIGFWQSPTNDLIASMVFLVGITVTMVCRVKLRRMQKEVEQVL